VIKAIGRFRLLYRLSPELTADVHLEDIICINRQNQAD